MNLTTRAYRILWNPGFLRPPLRFLLLLAHITDLPRFRAAIAENDDEWVSAAAEHTTLTAAELDEYVSTLYHETETLGTALGLINR